MNFNQYSVDFSIIFTNTKAWIHYLIISHVYGIFKGGMPYAMQLSKCGWRTLRYAKFQIYNFYIMANSFEKHILKHRLKNNHSPQVVILIGVAYLLKR